MSDSPLFRESVKNLVIRILFGRFPGLYFDVALTSMIGEQSLDI